MEMRCGGEGAALGQGGEPQGLVGTSPGVLGVGRERQGILAAKRRFWVSGSKEVVISSSPTAWQAASNAG